MKKLIAAMFIAAMSITSQAMAYPGYFMGSGAGVGNGAFAGQSFAPSTYESMWSWMSGMMGWFF